MKSSEKDRIELEELRIENRILKEKMKEKVDKEDELELIKEEALNYKKELDSIKYSRSYKLIQKMKKIMWWR